MELGMELMEKDLGGGQAESVTRAFVAFQHPNLVENLDYRPLGRALHGVAHVPRPGL